MKLIVGLGNPGAEYADTRHNAGFMAVDELARMTDAKFGRKEVCSSFVAEANAGGEKYILAKPQTYMNRSGSAVAALMKKYSIVLEDVTVIHDDIDVPLGTLKEKVGGGAGGHNGVSDIAQKLGSPDFRRIRVGVGRPPQGWDAADYVLSRFDKEERPVIEQAAGDCCKRALKLG